MLAARPVAPKSQFRSGLVPTGAPGKVELFEALKPKPIATPPEPEPYEVAGRELTQCAANRTVRGLINEPVHKPKFTLPGSAAGVLMIIWPMPVMLTGSRAVVGVPGLAITI